MSSSGNKFVRFEEWSSQKSFTSQQSSEDGFYSRKLRPTISTVWEGIRRGLEMGSERIASLRKPTLRFQSSKKGGGASAKATENSEITGKKILDPQGPFLQRWNKIFVFACAIAVSLDPLFFYIPVINRGNYGIDLDKKMETIAVAFRTVIDVFYILRIIFQFRTGFIAPSSRVFGRGQLVDEPGIIAKRYLTSYFLIDVLSILPLPQIVVLTRPGAQFTKDLLKIVIFSQFVPRLIRIYPLFKEVTSISGILTETAWAGAVYNLFLYIIASHIIGAIWYMLAIESEFRCWDEACRMMNCNFKNLYPRRNEAQDLFDKCPFNQVHCGRNETRHKYNFDNCSFDQIIGMTVSVFNRTNKTHFDEMVANLIADDPFDFGIYADALKSGVVEKKDFVKKFFYCFWWGLRNLSSLGQGLETSTYVLEIIFAAVICIAGLVLFALLIGNMQKYLQSTTVRIEEMRVKRRDAEQWMNHRMLPDIVKDRIRQYEQYKWQETRGVEERALIHNLPKDLRRDINRHLCFVLIKRVPLFEKMDEQVLDAVCDRLKPALYTKDSCIIREGDPVDEMLFIMRGNLESVTTNGGKTGFYNVVHLKPGDFCGEALLTWALDPQPSSNLPISTRTVKVCSDVEAFALVAEDLKSVASQFQRLHHKDIQHIFKFYSVQWRTWGACFIQAAWRRYWKRKQAKLLRQAEEDLQDALANETGTSPSLGATIYASRFAANALRNLRQHGARPGKLPQRLQLLPPKPSEPIFSPHGL